MATRMRPAPRAQTTMESMEPSLRGVEASRAAASTAGSFPVDAMRRALPGLPAPAATILATYCGAGDCCTATASFARESGKALFSILGEDSPGRNPFAGKVLVSSAGPHRFRVLDANGVEILAASGLGRAEYGLGALKSGVYVISVATATAIQTKRVFRF